AQLTRETRRVLFARLALAPGEFPIAFEVNAALPPGDEKRVIPFDDRGRHDDRRHSAAGLNGKARQFLAIGQTRHFGLRATQIVAPKSISAWLKSKTRRIGTSVAESVQRCRF